MHLFNAKLLSDELRADTVSQTETYHYMIVSVVLHMLSRFSQVLTSHSSPVAYFANLFLTVTISLLGLHVCFHANSRGDNRRFIERLLCLSAPLGVWYLVVYIASFYSIFFVSRTLMGAQAQLLFGRTSWFPMLFAMTALIIYLTSLCHFIARTSAIAPSQTDPIAAP